MPELEDSNEYVPQDEARERWRAMQTAYADYIRASEVFENSRELNRDSDEPGNCDVTLLDCRRDAFDRYMEARLNYLEHRYDEGYRREAAIASVPTRETGGHRTVSGLARLKWPLVPVVLVAILSVTAFSFAREQKHARDLDSVRDQLRAGLNDTRLQLQLLSKRLDARESTERATVRQVENTPQAAPAPSVDRRKPTAATRWRRVPEPTINTASRSVAARGYFSLSRSSQFKRVGPIKMSLKSVDRQRNSVYVSIVSESGKVNLQHLRLNQPVRIKSSYRGQPMELVVDRITENGLSGHLIEFHG
jgi:hypothetical protein